MNIPVISQLPQDVATVVLIVLLVVVFVAAFKIMSMVFETVMVSALSAGFYAALSQVLNYSFSFNQMLTYAFLGAVLYMSYSFLASAYSIARTVLKIPYHLIMIGLKPFKWGYEKVKEEVKLRKMRKKAERKKSSSTKSNDSGSTKEVVLDKVQKDKDQDS
jgi:hypothetical protein